MTTRNFKDEKYKGWYSRSIPIKPESIDEKTRSVECVMTTEDPAIVFDWWNWRHIREIILMKGVEYEKEIPFLNSHKRDDLDNVLGTTKDIRIEGDSLIGRNYFSSTEEKIWIKTKEGHLKNYSVGYHAPDEDSIELKAGQEVIIEGHTYINNYKDGLPLAIRKKTTVKENSGVALGADKRAKARAEGGISTDDDELQEEIDKMFEKIEQKIDEKINSIKIIGGTMPEETKTKTPEEIRQETASRIREFGQKNFKGAFKDKANEIAMDILTGKTEMTFEQFQGAIFTELQKSGGGTASDAGFIDMPDSDLKEYRFTTACRTQLENKNWMDGKFKDTSREIEAHHQLVKQFGEPKNGGMYIPIDARLRGLRDMELLGLTKRVHSAGTPGEGGYLVATELRPDMLIEFLKRDLVTGRLGATILTGLQGNLDIPKILSSLAAEAVAENDAATTTYLVFGHETIGPKIISANTVYGRQWFYQSSLNVDTLLFKHLEYAKNDKVENLAFNGTGLGNEPLGLLNEDGITDVDLSTVSFENILQPKTVIKKAKAFDGVFKWLVSPDVETKMQSTPIMAGQSPMLMDLNTGKMVGFDSEWTNQIPVDNLAFGNWPALFMMFWGPDELLVDPYTLSTAGSVRMTVFTMFNKFVQQEAAFNISSNVSIAA